jgi:ABC-type nickel/cobalt efflux system permease component RcnA
MQNIKRRYRWLNPRQIKTTMMKFKISDFSNNNWPKHHSAIKPFEEVTNKLDSVRVRYFLSVGVRDHNSTQSRGSKKKKISQYWSFRMSMTGIMPCPIIIFIPYLYLKNSHISPGIGKRT